MFALWRSQKSLQTQGSNTQATPSFCLDDFHRNNFLGEIFFFFFFFFRFVNALVYYGVFLSAPNIGGNFYLNFFLTSLIELPAIPAGVWAFNRFVEHRVHMKWTCFIKLLPILTLSLVAIGQEKCQKITKDLVHLFWEENNHVNEGFGHCNYI